MHGMPVDFSAHKKPICNKHLQLFDRQIAIVLSKQLLLFPRTSGCLVEQLIQQLQLLQQRIAVVYQNNSTTTCSSFVEKFQFYYQIKTAIASSNKQLFHQTMYRTTADVSMENCSCFVEHFNEQLQLFHWTIAAVSSTNCIGCFELFDGALFNGATAICRWNDCNCSLQNCSCLDSFSVKQPYLQLLGATIAVVRWIVGWKNCSCSAKQLQLFDELFSCCSIKPLRFFAELLDETNTIVRLCNYCSCSINLSIHNCSCSMEQLQLFTKLVDETKTAAAAAHSYVTVSLRFLRHAAMILPIWFAITKLLP